MDLKNTIELLITPILLIICLAYEYITKLNKYNSLKEKNNNIVSEIEKLKTTIEEQNLDLEHKESHYECIIDSYKRDVKFYKEKCIKLEKKLNQINKNVYYETRTFCTERKQAK